ncbi:hypothetical protein [Marinobacter subterrani]|uniref:hypothetical protein n=1 Tax=Marinobacter subterrani TaxID=1658765 RepID=UPI002352DD25|nr:hypothetical protein [Marinobacter subterrani]
MCERTFNPVLATTMLCASLILSACGGGGTSSVSSGSSGGTGTTLKAGLYKAKVLYLNGNPQQTATTYLSPTGKFAAVFGGNSGLTLGNLDFANTRITGTSSDYRQPDPKGFFEAKGVEDGTITGTITSQGSATFSTSDAEGQVDTNVTLQRQNALSDLGISLERASGIYVMSVTGQPDVALTVNSDGSLNAQYYDCQLGGIETLSVPDPSINVFNISYTMSNCNDDNRSGEYSGVGFFGPTTNGSMQMIFAAHNGIVAMKFEGIK